MEEIFTVIILTVFGLMLGSFAGATVWRIRARQLADDKAAGEDYDKKEYVKLLPLTKSSVRTDRSRCLHCEHPLAWYDLLPLVSWIGLRGKCRYCRAKIGWFEPLMEIGLALFFVVSYLAWPVPLDSVMDAFSFILWLIAGILLIILFAYDLKWFLLPDVIVFPLIAVGVIMTGAKVATASNVTGVLIDVAVSVTILSGLYYVLHKVSKGQWIGFGDVKLGLGLGLLLADWHLAFIALFAANLLGCLIVIPGMLAGKLTRTSRVPFGPLLIAGAVIAMLYGPTLVMAYFSALS
ncbi:MAG: putative Prepilin peptidase [Candidatus Saccharibacteria bacterium]|nr:putative Prepilin peptidase [Candidatus Saccharibacteria bacterium]